MCGYCGTNTCGGCGPFKVPEGPVGLQGLVGPQGLVGAQGIAGSNSWKFLKIFTIIGIEETLTITAAERTLCNPNPDACTLDTKDRLAFIDLHIQVWFRVDSTVPVWTLLKSSGYGSFSVGSDDYHAPTINHSTGLISIITGSLVGLYRVLIIG